MKLLKSFYHACSGIYTAVLSERNMRIHISIAIIVILSGLYLKFTAMEWIVVTLSIAMVLFVETLNTAIEYLCNFCSPQYHDTIKKVKDMAAGAVLIVIISVFIIAIFIYTPYLA